MEKWSPDFKKTWYKVNKEAYKIIVTEAKEKMEDTLSESESITNKSIKMITALVVMFGFYIGFFVQNHLKFDSSIPFLLPFFIIGCGIIYLIFPKKIRGRGFEPKELIPKELDAEEDKEYQEEILYYALIEKLQEDIDFMNNKNMHRARIYLFCMIGMLVLFIACSVNIAISLSTLS